jgi:hypothetical protein
MRERLLERREELEIEPTALRCIDGDSHATQW